MKNQTTTEILIFLAVLLCLALAILGYSVAQVDTRPYYIEPVSVGEVNDPCLLKDVYCEYEKEKTIIATVTGYNSVENQTDASPCVGAGGYICGRGDVIACPRKLALGTVVRVNNREFRCFDRLAPKYDNRFDIFFDKDVEKALAFGVQTLPVTILE